MPDPREPTVGIEIEDVPEGPFDLLRITLPLPRFSIFPKETRHHLRAARRERILALRSLLDAAIERLEEPEDPKRKTQRVKVE